MKFFLHSTRPDTIYYKIIYLYNENYEVGGTTPRRKHDIVTDNALR